MDRKFGFLRKKLELRKYQDREKKFILVMIDALGYDTLMDLKGSKYLPFLSKLMTRYNVTSYNVGIPTTTPYVQAGLFYNYNKIIPGFRFRDKKKKWDMSTADPEVAYYLDGLLKEKNKGILEGGSSLGNMFTGGAERNLFTFPGMHANSRITNVRDVLQVLVFNPFSIPRVLYYMVKDFFVEFYENIDDQLKKKKGDFVNWFFFYPFFPFFRFAINGFVREVLTEAAILEMKRKSPKICVNFHGFDWISHYRGANKKSSFLALKEIDKKLEWLYKSAKKEGYDFYVFSDHGIVPGVPFDKLYNQSLLEFVTRVKEKKREVRDKNWDYISYKLSYLHENFSLPLRVVNTFLKGIFKVKKKSKKVEQISVGKASCIAHIYFNDKEHRLDLSEIENLHPGVVDKLVNHDGIGLVIGMEKGEMKVLSKEKDVLRKYGDAKWLENSLKSFVKMKYFGDLFILGAIKDGKIVTFEDFHMATHDGFGLNQEKGFFLSEEKYNFSDSEDSRVLYSVFNKTYK